MPIILRIATGLISVAPSIGKYLMKELGLKQVSKTVAKNAKNIKKINSSQARNLVKKDKQLGPVIKKQDASESAIQKATMKKFGPKKITAKKITPKNMSSKPNLTKNQMVQAVSNKKVPDKVFKKRMLDKVTKESKAINKKVPSGGKQVPAKLKKLPVATQQKIARLGGLSKVKKLGKSANPALWKKLVGAGILVGSAAVPLIMDPTTVGKSTRAANNKRKSVLGGRGTINEKPGERAKAFKAKQKSTVTAAEQKAAGSFPEGTGTSLPVYSNNPIFKKLLGERGGRKKFEPDTTSGKMSRFGRIGNDSTNKIVAEAIYGDLDKIENRTAGEEKLHSQLYDTAMKRKGGKVGKKKGGMVKRSYGGKVKRNMGGMISPRKKVVFRRGGGRALRGMGKAIYSNKMY